MSGVPSSSARLRQGQAERGAPLPSLPTASSGKLLGRDGAGRAAGRRRLPPPAPSSPPRSLNKFPQTEDNFMPRLIYGGTRRAKSLW